MDGSLLDHHNYSHAAADVLLQKLEEQNIPVIPATSKTAAELLQLRDELDNTHPFIAENGAAVYIPATYFKQEIEETRSSKGFNIKEFSHKRAHWQSLINALHDEFTDSFATFEQLGVTGIMEKTGLDEASAKLAAQREYGEPVSWQGSESEKQKFIKRLQELGADVLQGGRFMHVSGKCDKGMALKWLTECYAKEKPETNFTSLAIGDSQNDIAMLEAADMALIIRSPVHAMPQLSQQQTVYKSQKYGPEGWVEGVENMLGFSTNIKS